jgi:hypothetical protein
MKTRRDRNKSKEREEEAQDVPAGSSRPVAEAEARGGARDPRRSSPPAGRSRRGRRSRLAANIYTPSAPNERTACSDSDRKLTARETRRRRGVGQGGRCGCSPAGSLAGGGRGHHQRSRSRPPTSTGQWGSTAGSGGLRV